MLLTIQRSALSTSPAPAIGRPASRPRRCAARPTWPKGRAQGCGAMRMHCRARARKRRGRNRTACANAAVPLSSVLRELGISRMAKINYSDLYSREPQTLDFGEFASLVKGASITNLTATDNFVDFWLSDGFLLRIDAESNIILSQNLKFRLPIRLNLIDNNETPTAPHESPHFFLDSDWPEFISKSPRRELSGSGGRDAAFGRSY